MQKIRKSWYLRKTNHSTEIFGNFKWNGNFQEKLLFQRFGYTSGGCILFGRFICKFAVFALFGPCGLYKVPSVVVFKSAVSTYQCFVCLCICKLNLKVKSFKNSKRTEVRLIVVQSGAVNRKILCHSSQEIFGNWLQNNVGSGNEFALVFAALCASSATLANSIFPRESGVGGS